MSTGEVDIIVEAVKRKVKIENDRLEEIINRLEERVRSLEIDLEALKDKVWGD